MSAYSETPSEILHEIFAIATKVPDPLVCFVQDYYGSRRDVTRRPYQSYKESLAMKLTLCAVSRHWNAVATPLLYERVIISGFEGGNEWERTQAGLLLRTLNSSYSLDAEAPNGGARLGTFIRRLDLTFSDGDERNQCHPELTGRGIAEIVSKLSNLEVLGVRSSPGASPLDTLQHLHWRTGASDIQIPIPSLLDFLDAHPSLETFHMIYDFEELDLGEAAFSLWDRQSYPSLRHWVLRQNQVDVLADVPSTVFPNLEALTFHYHPHSNDNLARFTKFLRVHGRHLITLRLSPYGFLKDLLSVVARSCPRLKELHLAYPHALVSSRRIQESSVVATMPQVTTLGLTLFDHYRDSHSSGWYMAIKLQWKLLFPGLRTIRLLEEIDVDRLRETPERLEEIANFCAEFGVTLEDNNSFFEEIRSQ
ncbi:hypothetical protein FA13DRAFT_1737604 [Coprinellus micaceus]|uniref:Uncharacterized protein n=1 Tax=Coprinellus micaceus TaxID=71717 RepID=A0A4Y7SWJ0_COPMI|nr:hypothetical protein FA13DRAFT_1737604 [Coprinellus micaceus]